MMRILNPKVPRIVARIVDGFNPGAQVSSIAQTASANQLPPQGNQPCKACISETDEYHGFLHSARFVRE
jgi:hypothetical protein